jgi:hypothetical protein
MGQEQSTENQNQSEVSHRNHDISRGNGDGTEILEQLKNNTWGAVSDVVENSIIRNYDTIECHKKAQKYINYEDNELIYEVPKSKTQRVSTDSRFEDIKASNRDQFIPNKFEEGVAEFVLEGTERVGACSICDGNTRVQCPTCGGSGYNQCGRCNGSGTNYDNTARCGKCGGSGTFACQNCDSVGHVACDVCNQEGTTRKVDIVRRHFTPKENVVGEGSGVPEEYITNADGEFVETEEKEPKSGEIRREVDIYRVPVEKVQYVYDDKDFEIFRVEGKEIEAESFPKNQARRMLPYAVAVAVIIAIIVFFFLSVLVHVLV